MSFRDILNDKQKVFQITKQAFQYLDEDGSGALEKREITQLMIKGAQALKIERPTKEEIEQVIKRLDQNNDGQLSQMEFQQLIEQVLDIISKIESK